MSTAHDNALKDIFPDIAKLIDDKKQLEIVDTSNEDKEKEDLRLRKDEEEYRCFKLQYEATEVHVNFDDLDDELYNREQNNNKRASLRSYYGDARFEEFKIRLRDERSGK